jgi:hypothetical protein
MTEIIIFFKNCSLSLYKQMKTVQKITSVFLALTFLVSSLGFTVNKMVCLKSGKTKLSLTRMKDCCPEKETALPVVKSDCCDITNTFFDLGDLRVSQKTDIVQPFAIQSFLSASGYQFKTYSFSDSEITLFADLPPPRSGRSLLAFISVLII